jgi:hypothetical protein
MTTPPVPDFINDLANAQRFDSGNFFQPGRGVLIVKDVKVFASTKDGGDPFTYAAEFLVKKSTNIVEGRPANAEGTSVSVIYKPTRSEYPKMQKSNIAKCNMAILGSYVGQEVTASLAGPQLAQAISELLRPFPTGNPLAGRTDPSKPCPARGYQITYETIKGKKPGKDGRDAYYPEFSACTTSEAELAENLKLLAGAASEEG